MEGSSLREIFGVYDIRGVYPSQINEKIAYKIGVGIAKFFREGTIGISRDIRFGSEEIKRELISALIRNGINVVDFGVLPTPLLYFGVINWKLDGGISVTASHNPPNYNGIKIVGKNAVPIGMGYGLEKILELSKDGGKNSEKKGTVERNTQIIEEYIEFISKKINIQERIKVVTDNCNGVVNLVLPRIFRALDIEFLSINSKIDPKFPNRMPEPTRENLSPLSRIVVKERASFGVGFDGDGDRSVFIDDKGRILDGSQSLFSLLYFLNLKSEKIVYDISCSHYLYEFIRKKGGIPIEEKVGNLYIKRRMEKENALVGGEYSSHFYFREIGHVDDGIFSLLKMAQIYSEKGRKLSEIVSKIPKTYRIEEKIQTRFKREIVEKVRRVIEKTGNKYSEVDGIKVWLDNGWFLIRASNTQPLIRVIIETGDEESLDQMRKYVKEVLGKCGLKM